MVQTARSTDHAVWTVHEDFHQAFFFFFLSVNSECELMIINARLHSLLSVTPSFCFVFSPPVLLSRLFCLLVVQTHKETSEYDVYRYVYKKVF